MEIEVVAGSEDMLPVVNASEVAFGSLADDDGFRELARSMTRWVNDVRAATGRISMFERGMYTPPDNPFDEIRSARAAVRYDDVVSGVAEITESFAFQGIKWESDDPEVSDVFNQMARDLDLDSVVRRIWREEFSAGQAVCAFEWGTKTYTLRGKTDTGKKSKKKYTIQCPVGITILDSTSVIPLTNPMGEEVLGWIGGRDLVDRYKRVINGDVDDPTMLEFYVGEYQTKSDAERRELFNLGVNPEEILLLNPDRVFRHCATKPDYQRFPDVRLRSCFGLLDLKRQLMTADRASLVGAANYILLIRKGSKEEPATKAELENLKENYSVIAKMPVIISDHRLEIEIVAPKIDLTLQSEKYDVIDARLLSRLLGTLSIGGKGQRNETNVTMSYAVGRNMENRRHMLRRFLERTIARAVVDHPANTGLLSTDPSLVYTPRNINLGMEAAMVQALLSLRNSREISRETILEQFGMDQATEAMRREMEAEEYDEIFGTLAMPGQTDGMGDPNDQQQDDPNGQGTSPQVNGGKGGRPVGGGKPTANPGKVAPKTPSGATKPQRS